MKKSAGLLLYRFRQDELEVFLVHPGGPFWKSKDLSSWSIPKGEFDDQEEPLTAAKRELFEETKITGKGPFIELPLAKQKSGKLIYAWATEQDVDEKKIVSNQFEIEWPPRSGTYQGFPEVDRAAWFTVQLAKKKIIPGQIILIEALADLLKTTSG